VRAPLTRSLLLRASWSTGSARPALSQVMPNTTVAYATDGSALGTVTQNNTGLKPQYSDNLDLALEYYLDSAGLISVGVFQKEIKDFITSQRSLVGTGANNGFDGRYAGFELVTQTNLSSAEIRGLELNYSQRLSFLPKPFNGLSLWGNYTKLETEGTYNNGASALQGFVPETRKAGLSFNWRGFEARVSYHQQSAYLVGYSAQAVNTNYFARNEDVDVNLQYQFRPWLQFYADIANLTNKAPNTYNISPNRPHNVELWGTRVTFGISGRF
jgi:iron complex outermembrane recepter protein